MDMYEKYTIREMHLIKLEETISHIEKKWTDNWWSSSSMTFLKSSPQVCGEWEDPSEFAEAFIMIIDASMEEMGKFRISIRLTDEEGNIEKNVDPQAKIKDLRTGSSQEGDLSSLVEVLEAWVNLVRK